MVVDLISCLYISPRLAPTPGSTPVLITTQAKYRPAPLIPAGPPPARPCPTHACSSRPASRKARRSARCGRAPTSPAARGSRLCTRRAARSLARSAERTPAEVWVAGTAPATERTGRSRSEAGGRAQEGAGRERDGVCQESGSGASHVFPRCSVLGGAT